MNFQLNEEAYSIVQIITPFENESDSGIQGFAHKFCMICNSAYFYTPANQEFIEEIKTMKKILLSVFKLHNIDPADEQLINPFCPTCYTKIKEMVRCYTELGRIRGEIAALVIQSFPYTPQDHPEFHTKNKIFDKAKTLPNIPVEVIYPHFEVTIAGTQTSVVSSRDASSPRRKTPHFPIESKDELHDHETELTYYDDESGESVENLELIGAAGHIVHGNKRMVKDNWEWMDHCMQVSAVEEIPSIPAKVMKTRVWKEVGKPKRERKKPKEKIPKPPKERVKKDAKKVKVDEEEGAENEENKVAKKKKRDGDHSYLNEEGKSNKRKKSAKSSADALLKKARAVQKIVSCEICDAIFKSKKMLIPHMRVHTGEKPFKCNKCEEAFTFRNDLKEHNKIHKKNFGVEPTVECDECGKKFNVFGSLRMHKWRYHNPKFGYVKPVEPTEPTNPSLVFGIGELNSAEAELRTAENSILGQHLTKASEHISMDNTTSIHDVLTEAIEPLENENFEVTEKPKGRRRSMLSNPLFRNREIKKRGPKSPGPKECPYCSKLFKDIYSLQPHIRSHTGEKPLKCRHCDKMFNSAGNRSKHEKIHLRNNLEPESFPCSYCGRVFALQGSLYHHTRRKHLGIKYKTKVISQCELCGSVYASESGLKYHMMVAHNSDVIVMERKYPCKICEKPFRCPSDAKKHEDIHNPEYVQTKLSQYKCPECKDIFGFKTKMELRRHFSETHPDQLETTFVMTEKSIVYERQFRCSKCPSYHPGFITEHYLQRHLLNYHSEQKTRERKEKRDKKRNKKHKEKLGEKRGRGRPCGASNKIVQNFSDSETNLDDEFYPEYYETDNENILEPPEEKASPNIYAKIYRTPTRRRKDDLSYEEQEASTSKGGREKRQMKDFCEASGSPKKQYIKSEPMDIDEFEKHAEAPTTSSPKDSKIIKKLKASFSDVIKKSPRVRLRKLAIKEK